MKTKIILILGILAILGGCGGEADQPQGSVSKVEPVSDLVFVNPEFDCPAGDLVEPGEGYPHPSQDFPASADPERSLAQFEDFCGRMDARFAEPGMTESEAKQVFEAIPQVLTIQDESDGMPSPDDPPIPPVVLETRVKMRKIAEGKFEIFYYWTGCGRNYDLYELDLSGDRAEARIIESWAERRPC